LLKYNEALISFGHLLNQSKDFSLSLKTIKWYISLKSFAGTFQATYNSYTHTYTHTLIMCIAHIFVLEN